MLGVDVENLSFDNLRFFQGAESEVSITVNPEFLVDQDESGGETTTGEIQGLANLAHGDARSQRQAELVQGLTRDKHQG